MKRKQLLKTTRDISEDNIRCHLEAGGHHVSDYFLVGENGNYIWGIWTADGKPQLLFHFSEDEIGHFAIEQFLLQNVPVYKKEEEIPVVRPAVKYP